MRKRETLRRAMNALALLLLVAMSAPANARSYSDVGRKEQAASLRRALQSWDTSEDVAEDKYLVTFRDLNNDGKEEAVAYVVGTDWCGSGGCVTLVRLIQENLRGPGGGADGAASGKVRS